MTWSISRTENLIVSFLGGSGAIVRRTFTQSTLRARLEMERVEGKCPPKCNGSTKAKM